MSDVERYGVIALGVMGVLLLGILLKDEMPWADDPAEVTELVDEQAGRKVSNRSIVIPRTGSPPAKRSAANSKRLAPVTTPASKPEAKRSSTTLDRTREKSAAALAQHRVKELEGMQGAFTIDEPPIAYPGPNAAKSVAPSKPAIAGGPPMHEIVSGDTLSSIASTYLGSSAKWKQLVEWNPGITPETLKIGQMILVSRQLGDPAPAASEPTTPVVTDDAPRPGTYEVQRGDTLSGIASKVMGSIKYTDDLYNANRDILKSKNDLKVGQTLKIP